MRQAADKMPRKRTSIPRDPELATLGEAIEVLRKRRGITQTDVANACDLEVKQVGNYARGQTGPTYRNLRRLCRGLGVTPATLMLTIEEIEGDEHEHERPSVTLTPDAVAGAVG
jgi:transcriptional regulator with XRE-family HTH domain